MSSLLPQTHVPFGSANIEVNDLISSLMILSEGAEKQLREFVLELKTWVGQRITHSTELAGLQAELVKSQTNVAALEKKLRTAQHLLGEEKNKRINCETKVKQIFCIMERLKGHGDAPPDQQLFSLLSSTLEGGYAGGGTLGSSQDGGRHIADSLLSPRIHLSTIDERCDSLNAISDIDLTEGDELEVSSVLQSTAADSPDRRRSGRKRQSSCSPDQPKRKRQEDLVDPRHKLVEVLTPVVTVKSHVSVEAPVFTSKSTPTTTVTSSVYGVYCPTAPPCDDWPLGRTPTAVSRRQAPLPPTPQVSTPHSQYSTPPQQSPLLRSHMSRAHTRMHCFYTKTIFMSDYCQPCSKRIKFGNSALKCRDCRAVCHPDCRDKVPEPCVPTVTTPGSRHHRGVISDYTPSIAPMVPSLVVHCTYEIEERGLSEVGIYRVSALERDVKVLKDQFLRGKGLPNISHTSQYDVHTLCGTVKHFLRGLKESLITHTLWDRFVKAASQRDEADCVEMLYQAVTELPQPNRDTLAWMIRHLQRISEATECCMSASNLAKVFGPTLVGYSMPDPDPEMILLQTADQNTVMTKLLSLSRDYWEAFLQADLFSGSIANETENTPPNLRRNSSNNNNNRRRSIISRTPLGRV